MVTVRLGAVEEEELMVGVPVLLPPPSSLIEVNNAIEYYWKCMKTAY